MSNMTPGLALRQILASKNSLRKARQSLTLLRGDDSVSPKQLSDTIRHAWQALTQTHKLLGELPFEAASEDVMLKQISLERYATALLVRLRRLARGDLSAADPGDDDEVVD